MQTAPSPGVLAHTTLSPGRGQNHANFPSPGVLAHTTLSPGRGF